MATSNDSYFLSANAEINMLKFDGNELEMRDRLVLAMIHTSTEGHCSLQQNRNNGSFFLKGNFYSLLEVLKWLENNESKFLKTGARSSPDAYEASGSENAGNNGVVNNNGSHDDNQTHQNWDFLEILEKNTPGGQVTPRETIQTKSTKGRVEERMETDLEQGVQKLNFDDKTSSARNGQQSYAGAVRHDISANNDRFDMPDVHSRTSDRVRGNETNGRGMSNKEYNNDMRSDEDDEYAENNENNEDIGANDGPRWRGSKPNNPSLSMMSDVEDPKENLSSSSVERPPFGSEERPPYDSAGSSGRRERRLITSKTNEWGDDSQSQSPYSRDRIREFSRSSSTPQNVQFAHTLPKTNARIFVYSKDITGMNVDCLVNAANESLMHGGGVAGAIASKAGHMFIKESNDYIRKNGKLKVGDAVATSGGNLCSFVIHAVGPAWYNYKPYEKENCVMDLNNAFTNSLKKAVELQVSSIALPAISSGIFGVPLEIVVNVMWDAILSYDEQTPGARTNLRELHLVNIKDDITDEIAKTFRRKVFNNIQVGQWDFKKKKYCNTRNFSQTGSGTDKTSWTANRAVGRGRGGTTNMNMSLMGSDNTSWTANQAVGRGRGGTTYTSMSLVGQSGGATLSGYVDNAVSNRGRGGKGKGKKNSNKKGKGK